MSNQKWADACTSNCLWLLQKRDIPGGCWKEIECEERDESDEPRDDEPEYEVDEESLNEDQCWSTEAVFLNRLEAFEAGARRVYNYGQYGKDWRIYGVPAQGSIVEFLSSSGVNQELIDKNVDHYRLERAEWEKKDHRLKGE